MAITRHLAKLLLREHRHRPISGDVLILARQTVFLTPEQAIALIRSEGVELRRGGKIEKDQFTARGRALGYISDESFFSLFSDARVQVLDFTGYQGATIIQDLCAPLPAALLGKFSFIYNGSVLDNLFDSAAAMDNITRLLAPDGVAFHYEGARHFGWAYAQFPPEWFFDYGAINRFDDCKVYYCTHQNIHESDWDAYFWLPYHDVDGKTMLTSRMRHDGDSVIVSIMQRDAMTSVGARPIQVNYRPDHQPYLERLNHYMNHGRKIVAAPVTGWPGHWHIGKL